MHRYKNLACLLTGLVILALVGAACATPTPVEVTRVVPVEVTRIVAGTPVVEVVTATPEPTPEPVTLVFGDWHLTEPHWEKALKEAFQLFEAKYPHIHIELWTTYPMGKKRPSTPPRSRPAWARMCSTCMATR